MSEDQLKVEIDWCLARLEEKLAGVDPLSKSAQEAAKVHRILKSRKAPVAKKRQAMRNMFGDYREKMRALEKKNLAAMKKSKLMAVKEPSSESKFLRCSASIRHEQNIAHGQVSSATNDFNQLSVGENDSSGTIPETVTTENHCSVAENIPEQAFAAADFKFNFDQSECPADSDGACDSLTSCSRNHSSKNRFVWKPSNEEFRFNFTLTEDDEVT